MTGNPRLGACLGGCILALVACGLSEAAAPDHPIITEVYTDAVGPNDGPSGRDPASLHQEYIELYLPACADLRDDLDCDALNLTLYEVEGDHVSSGLGLVNYRIDLPTFDLNPDNGLSGLPRPADGVVVVGWVDYNNDLSDLLGTPSTRVALVNGGVTETTEFTFIALNGDFGSGTTNFPTPGPNGMSSVDEDQASSGIIQNGSGAYLLVNRDDVGYVELFDDEHVPDGESADPDLPGGIILETAAPLDGYAGNDDSLFVVEDQPLEQCSDDPIDCIDLQNVLRDGGAFSLLIAQVPEEVLDGLNPGQANGYARVYIDVPKTTEGPASDDPAEDAISAYRHIRNDGPFHPTPGRIVRTTSPPELGVSTTAGQVHEVLSETTRSAGLLAANVGGNFDIDVAVTEADSSDAAAAAFAPDAAATNVGRQALAFPSVLITGGATAAHEAEVPADVTLTATNSSGGDPAVLFPIQTITATARVLNPSTGSDENGQPFQTTIFVAVFGLVSDPGVLNEFLNTSLADYLATQPDVSELDTLDHGFALMDPTTNLSDQLTVRPWIKELPEEGEECTTWLSPAGPPGRLDFAQTVIMSAEAQSDSATYEFSVEVCSDGKQDQDVIKAIRLNVPDTKVFGGSFSPTESVHFVGSVGEVGASDSGLTDVTTSRSFEVALIDTAVRFNGSLETGSTDDFGIIIEVEEVEADSPMLDGEFVLVSFTGGLQGADVDTLAVPPGNLLATITLLDLENLHEVLRIRSIEAVYIIDAGESGEVEFIEAFSLNLASSPATEACCLPDDSCSDLEPATCLDSNGTPLGSASVCSGTDTDEDGTVDDCDPDDDNDGIPDAQDNCPLHHKPDQDDCDNDGIGNVCAIDSGASEDTNGNGIPDECESNCPEDFDRDGGVGPFDLAFVLGNWGPNPGHPADLNGDGVVGAFDLALLLGAWDACV